MRILLSLPPSPRPRRLLTRALGTLLFVLNTSYADNVVTIRADQWFPMNGDPKADKPGYMIELAQAILTPHGYTVDYQLLPWKRSIRHVIQGKADCVVGAYRDENRQLIFPEEPWGIDRIDFYVTKDSGWRFTGQESLQGITIGIIGGYSYGETLNQLIKDPRNKDQFQIVSTGNALELNIRNLERGRITTTVESVYVMDAKLRELGLQNKIISAGTLAPGEPMYIACSPERATTQQYLRWFDEGTRRLRRSGELQTLMSRYGLSDWKQTSD